MYEKRDTWKMTNMVEQYIVMNSFLSNLALY